MYKTILQRIWFVRTFVVTASFILINDEPKAASYVCGDYRLSMGVMSGDFKWGGRHVGCDPKAAKARAPGPGARFRDPPRLKIRRPGSSSLKGPSARRRRENPMLSAFFPAKTSSAAAAVSSQVKAEIPKPPKPVRQVRGSISTSATT